MSELNASAIINAIRGTDRYIEVIYTEGGCYAFHKFLKVLFPDCEVLINADKNHVVTLINGLLYDITGFAEDQEYNALTPEDLVMVEDWSFCKSSFLSIGECSACEEPVLVLLENNK